MTTSPGDTQEKIIMKDHDILISLHTQNDELIRRVDGLSSQINDSQKNNYQEFRNLAVSQAKMEVDVKSLHGKDAEQDERLDKMDTHWKRGDLALLLGTIVAGLIGWFK